MGKSTRWNKIKCLDFLRRFDAFEHKYLFKIGRDENDSYCRDRVHKVMRSWFPEEKAKWDDILNAQSHGASNHNLSYEDEASAAKGIYQVYKDAECYTNEYLEMLDLVRDHFIYDYTGIDGLCEFFSPAYFEFEWGMHLEIDYARSNSRYYRDHYVHQIRNLFEMFTLLDQYGYYQKCRDVYYNPESRVGTFIFEAIEQEILSLTDQDRSHYRDILDMNGCNDVGTCCSQTENYYSGLRELMFHFIVYSSTIIASIVHDIGYPISYIRRISGRLSKTLPICQLLTSITSDYTSIEQALQNSLLFKTVPHEKIKNRLQSTEEHGVQSAIVLLMYFCQHGGRLSLLQKCAIDVAALIIYNHTNKYNVINKPIPEPDLFRSDILKEPLSHIFRMCDDLQEWDRVYFEVTDQSNIMICPRCGTPITRKYATDISTPINKRYYCCCTDYDHGYFDSSRFVSRRIINVIGCEDMQVEHIPIEADGMKDGDAGTRFELNYDCGNLLNILTFSRTFAMKRANGVKDLKKLHSYQGMFDSVLIDSFASANPFAVKVLILEKYGIERIRCLFADCSESSINDILSTNKNVYRRWKRNFAFYYKMYELGIAFKNCCETIIDSHDRICNILFGDEKDAIKKEIEAFFEFLKKSCTNNESIVYDSLKEKLISFFYVSSVNVEKLKNITESFNKSLLSNTTNIDVLKRYEEWYKLINRWFKKAANELISSSIDTIKIEGFDCAEFNLNNCAKSEPVCSLAVDYLMQQVHMLGYEKMYQYIQEVYDIRKSGSTSVTAVNIYRQYYENLNCINNKIQNSIDKYISRSDYECIKERCKEGDNSENNENIDFFIDFAFYLELWNRVRQRKQFYFSSAEYAMSRNYCKYYLGEYENNDSGIVLECITDEYEFDNQYIFRVFRRENDLWKVSDLITLSIDWKLGVGTLSSNKKDYSRLLEPVLSFHNIKLSKD